MGCAKSIIYFYLYASPLKEEEHESVPDPVFRINRTNSFIIISVVNLRNPPSLLTVLQ